MLKRFLDGRNTSARGAMLTGSVLWRCLLLGGLVATLWAVSSMPGKAAEIPLEASTLFAKHCAVCHGSLRYGGYAPPLIPAMLRRIKDDKLAHTIRDGLPQTQMQGFGAVLTPAAIDSLVKYLRTPVGEVRWEERDIRASRLEFKDAPSAYRLPESRAHVILVVERGTGSIAVLNGNTLAQLDKYFVGRIHGGPKFDESYRSVFASTRDGTVAGYDLANGRLIVKAKVAVNTRNLAFSPDGKWVAVANQLPQNLVLLNNRLDPRKIIPLPGKPSAVYVMPGKKRFVLTLRDVPRLLLVSYPGMRVESVELPMPFEDFMFVPGTPHLLASSRGGKEISLYDLEKRKVLKTLPTSGLPHLFSAGFFMRGNTLYAALNHFNQPMLSILNMERFEVEKEIPLVGAGYFVRTHPGTPYLWVDTNTEQIQLVRKADFTLLKRTLHPAPGKKAMHVEFTHTGDRALVSLWHPKGAVVVYDAVTLREKARLPFNMPVGKYNARNKTHPPLK